jgi:hypothetical protein
MKNHRSAMKQNGDFYLKRITTYPQKVCAAPFG